MKKIFFFLPLCIILFTKYSFAQSCFNSPVNLTTGFVPNSACTGDFNGDGKSDLAIASYTYYSVNIDTVSILLGTGAGSFGSPVRFTTGSLPTSIITADFNGDGKADLATANEGSNGSLSVLLSTGAGSFGAAVNFIVGSNPLSLICHDFNGDGKLDLATANSQSSNISILLGTGTGNFSNATNFMTGILPWSLCSADFNLDGKLDIATANDSSNVVWVLLGTGTGGFGSAVSYTVDINPISIISSDFNGDCKPDLATANHYSYFSTHVLDISILLGTGTGTFGSATNYTLSAYPNSIISSDFNGDGKADLAATMGDTNGVAVLLNCGSLVCTEQVNEIKNKNVSVSVFPNPALNSISINTNNISEFKNSIITIQNILGEEIKKISFVENIDVSELSQGCYFLQINLPSGENYKTKFIKQ